MAAAISAINAKIRSRPVLSYFCSTHFWGPASNFGIPIAAVMDVRKDPEMYAFHLFQSSASSKTELHLSTPTFDVYINDPLSDTLNRWVPS
ncbi:hypothetical protein MMC29_001965 [Sticta canariensis]|nr:hypothetical protein [Sticta canariensis]